MGFYLNGTNAYGLFQEEFSLTYFVDKSEILKELVPILELNRNASVKTGADRGKNPKYVCITRPRRFGKTVIANMINSFFGKGVDSKVEFDTMNVSKYAWYQTHLNKHNVIHIAFNEMPNEIASYAQYIARIKNLLMDDLMMAFPSVRVRESDAVWDVLRKIYEYCGGEKFIFVLDEWDFIYHQDFVSVGDKEAFTKFLSNLLKDKAYVEMAYMTGILPITKYSSGSELNMFFEYTMATREKYSEYFGFTEKEVDELYQRYEKRNQIRNVSREGLKLWYDGYYVMSGKRLYNPRSVVGALSDNQLGSYWTSSGPYDEIFYYIENNVAQVRDDLALMISGTPVSAKVQEYAASSMKLTTRDEIFSAMVVYGFLSYEDGYVSIPNKELMDKFADMIQKEPSLGYVHRLAKESERMLRATKSGDTKTMIEILEYAHNTEVLPW